MLSKARATYHEFPLKFWVLVVATFIDRLGGTIIQPFFALYVTKKFNVGMTEAGLLLGLFSLAGMGGSFAGGALTDKFGRRSMVLFGLVFSALSSVSMGLVNELAAFYTLAILVGALSSVAFPAHQAMVADLLPEGQRAEGFGILRVVANLSWILGPTIGGLLAAKSYLLLFVLDAIFSLITAAIVFRLVPETKPEATTRQRQETFLQTLGGYRLVARDFAYMGFLLASMLMTVVYLQMYSTLSVFLRDVHGVPERGFGLLLSLDAGVVVLLQFWVTRRVKRRPPLLMMALGTVLYMAGFSMYGFVATYALFVVAILLITFGEMVVMPVAQAIVARFAPEDMRGRYMAFYSLSWSLPSAVGPWAAGMIMGTFDPRWVWYLGGIIAAIAAGGFLLLHLRTGARFALPPEEKDTLPVTV